ncbi:MAG: hypothetical protein N3B21_08325 [Clostridia bacterium]|nr:hypothetical protein [Clostridia bacterium]
MILLKEFFDKYTSPDSNIHKIGNAFIVKKFFELEQIFRDHDNNPESDMIWEDLCEKINEFYIMVENEYWNNIHVIYGKYKWNRFVSEINVFLRIWYTIVRAFYETSVFAVIVCSWVVYFGIMNIILPQKLFPKNYLVSFSLLWLICAGALGFAIMLSSHYLALTQNEHSLNNRIKKLIYDKLSLIIKKIIRKLFPQTTMKYEIKKKDKKVRKSTEQPIKMPANPVKNKSAQNRIQL